MALESSAISNVALVVPTLPICILQDVVPARPADTMPPDKVDR